MRAFRKTFVVALAVAVVVSTAVFVPGAGAVPTTYWVDIANGDNANPGTEASPLKTIDAGLAHAVSGDTVVVLPGTYGTGPGQAFPIVMKQGVRLRSTDGPAETRIEGPGTNDVIKVINATSGTWIEGFTITDTAPAGGNQCVDITRGAVGPLVGWPRIDNCIIEGGGNTSSTGGGIFVEGVASAPAQPRIDNCVIRNNVADEGGGAYFGQYSDAVLLGCTVEGNAAQRGGGVCTRTEVGLFMYFCTLMDNAADLEGGGIAAVNGGGELFVYGGEVRDNTAGYGGGILVRAYNPIFDSISISDNTAATGAGGGIFHNLGQPTLQNCLIAGNTADEHGGATYGATATLNMYNCTVVANTSASGFNGVYADTSASCDAEIYNSILWGHSGEDVHGATVISYTDTQDTDLAADGNSGVANVMHADPLFVGMPVSHRLSPDSPCIDAADPGLIIVEDFFGWLRPEDGDGDGVSASDMGYHEYVIPQMDRTNGPDRYETAVEVSKRWTSHKTAIVASGENFPDALSAAGLAGGYDCPLLLVRKDSIPTAVKQRLTELNTETIYIIGGEAAVSAGVSDELEAMPDVVVDRIFGEDRYETAADVARKIALELGLDFEKTALIARGDHFPDALALSPLSYRATAYRGGAPILLTRPGQLSPATAAVIDELGIDGAYVAGGEAAVSSAVKSQIDAKLVANGGIASTRWSGSDRYATAGAVAEGGAALGWGSWRRVGIATGSNFPDALAGGAGMGRYGGVILLTRPDELSDAAAQMIAGHLPEIVDLEVLGGEAAITAGTYGEIAQALGL